MKKKRKVKKNKSIILRLLILCVCAYFTLTLGSLWSDLKEKKEELKAKEELYAATLTQVEEYRSLSDADNDKIIEKAARERFGFVYPNEQKFIDISGN